MPPRQNTYDFTTIVLDVSPTMIPSLECAARGLCDLLERKMIATNINPKHRASVILYGTQETSNPVATEQELAGFPGQFSNITLAQEMGEPTIDYFKSLKQAAQTSNSVPADFLDALFVALDGIIKLTAADELAEKKGTQTIILLSNFLTPLVRPLDDVVVESAIAQLQNKGVRLHIISLDEAADAQHLAVKNANANILATLCAEVDHTLQSITRKELLAGIFKSSEVSTTALMVSSLDIGTALSIQVKVATKVQVAKTPALGKESPMFAPGEDLSDLGPGAGELETVKEWYGLSDPNRPIPEDEVLRCYRYGKQAVPVEEGDEQLLKYIGAPGGIKLLGFVPAANIPRHTYMGTPMVIVPHKDAPIHGTALAALTAAMTQKSTVAILRFGKANPTKIWILVATPHPTTANHPAHLVCNDLPFAEDVRDFVFAGFDRPEKQPNEEQVEGMKGLVERIRLGKEELRPEESPNPTLHRFSSFMVERVLDATAAVPSEDPLLEVVTQPSYDDSCHPGASSAASLLSSLFPTGPWGGGKAKKAVYKLRKGKEREDFVVMMQQGNVSDGMGQMRKLVEGVVGNSSGDAEYQQAVELVQLMREQCLAHGQANSFNNHFTLLCSQYAKQEGRQDFLLRVKEEGLTLVRDKETGVGGVEEDVAADYIDKLLLKKE